MEPLSALMPQMPDVSFAKSFFTTERIVGMIWAVVIVTAAVPVARLLREGVVSSLGRRWSVQQCAIARRAVTYIIYTLSAFWALDQVGFDLKYLVGSVGVLALAVTYSSQKSVSQIISGIFIIVEQPFVLGDTITVSGITGEVISIDLLSIKLRTADNLFVRVPSESLLSAPVTNASHYTIRRLDIDLSVSYREDISAVSKVLFDVASGNPLVLEEPKPLFIFGGYGSSALKMQFCVWGRKESFLDMKNSMYEGIKKAFDAEGIEMPYPHMALLSGAGKDSIAISMAQAAK